MGSFNKRVFTLVILTWAGVALAAAPPDSSKLAAPTTQQVIYTGTETVPGTVNASVYFNQLRPCPIPPVCPNINETFSIPNYMQRTANNLVNVTIPKNTPVGNPPIYSSPGVLKTISLNVNNLNTATTNYAEICPKMCAQSRTVTINASTNQITNIREAICPAGYVQVGSFGVESEIIYNQTATPLPFPILSLDTYNQYVAKGYTCTLDSTEYSRNSGCQQSNGAPATFGNWEMSYTFDKPLNTPVVYSGGVVSFTKILPAATPTHNGSATSGGCWNIYDGGCTTNVGNCVLSCSASSTATTSTYYCHHASNSGVPFTQRYTQYYKYYRCEIPVGLVFSDNKLPASAVCARNVPMFRNN